ncbi:hypothetical protein BDEG_27850 [Batrachochytrium dendrobatidis JEL423]|uniref:Extracellular metalloproteinase n=1 Tax=Batrachochytrium dendrobatidis (strain JEL423) TaxID=403673 RepID=A0A177WYZ3_BATDL|nr:hypothetical protein BDEG_27850 [Batrachochytrium dendrobatidis JEL423]
MSGHEIRGMSKGWSDIFAMIVTAKESDKADTPVILGAYVINKLKGIRSHPYTTDMKINPLTYGDLKTRTELHEAGKVWATMLWEVYWNLVTKSGFSTNLYDAKGKAGNIVAMQNLSEENKSEVQEEVALEIKINRLSLFNRSEKGLISLVNARDAIIASDAAYYNGANKCEIWKGFAKRGLGVNAADYTNDFSVPAECGSGSPPPLTTTRGPKPTSGCTRMDICCIYVGKSCDQD